MKSGWIITTICTTSYQLREDRKITRVAVTEGEDKPIKYPQIFHEAELSVITKIDLLPYLGFDLGKLYEYIHHVNPEVLVLELSSKGGVDP